MATGGFTRLLSGEVVVALRLPRPGGAPASGSASGSGEDIRVIVLAANRQRALTRLRNLGFRSVRLSGNAHPPTADEVRAVLHHPDGLVWRDVAAGESVGWQSFSALR
jgi:hypothetical protein